MFCDFLLLLPCLFACVEFAFKSEKIYGNHFLYSLFTYLAKIVCHDKNCSFFIFIFNVFIILSGFFLLVFEIYENLDEKAQNKTKCRTKILFLENEKQNGESKKLFRPLYHHHSLRQNPLSHNENFFVSIDFVYSTVFSFFLFGRIRYIQNTTKPSFLCTACLSYSFS